MSEAKATSTYAIMVRWGDRKTPDVLDMPDLAEAYREMMRYMRNTRVVLVSIHKKINAATPPMLIDRLERTGGIHGNSTKPETEPRSGASRRWAG